MHTNETRYTLARVWRRLLVVALLSMLAAANVLPLIWDAGPEEPSTTALPFASRYRVRQALAAPLDDMDTTADQVYGQADYASAAAPNPPTASSANAPAGVIVAYSGQVIVADTGNNRVLVWDDLDEYEDGDPADVVLGQPNFTSNAAPDPPTANSLNAPWAVALDWEGNLYVSDSGNNRVLVFEPTDVDEYDFLTFEDGMAASLVVGQPSFVANTPPLTPTAASLNHPMGIVLDYDDNLVVADRDNNRVVMFEAPLETGQAAAWVIGQPADLELDPDAVFGDMATNAALDPPTATSLNHPTGVAIGAAADELYVADTGNHRVLIYGDKPLDGKADWVIGQPTFTSNTPNNGGVSASSLSSPSGVAIDASDRLYVADTGNHRVLEYDAPLISQVANLVFGQDGSFTTNTPNNGGVSEDSLNAPTAIAAEENYWDVFIADQGNHRVLQYDEPLDVPTPKIAELYPGTVRAGSAGLDLEVWGTGIYEDTIVQVNGQAREAESDYLGVTLVTLTAADLAAPGALTIKLSNPAPGGDSVAMALTVYVPHAGDVAADSVIGQDGFTSDYGPFEPVDAATLFEPLGVAVDARTGRVFVADSQNFRVLSWSSQAALNDGALADLVIGWPDFFTAEYDEAVTASALDWPAGLAVDGSGNLYVADPVANRVLIYQAPLVNGMAASRVIGQPDFETGDIPDEPAADNLNNPLGLAVDSLGNLYVADGDFNRVLEYDTPLTSDAVADRVWGQPNFTTGISNTGGLGAASLYFPAGVALDADGHLYVADMGNNRVLVYLDPLTGDATADRVFGQGGSFTTNVENKGGISAASLRLPSSVAVDGSGVLYVNDAYNHRILAYRDPLTSDTVADVVLGQGGSFDTRAPNKGGISAESLLMPYALAVDSNRNLFVADHMNNRVLGYLQPVTLEPTNWIYLPLVIRNS